MVVALFRVGDAGGLTGGVLDRWLRATEDMGGCGFRDGEADRAMAGGVAALPLCEGESLAVEEEEVEGLFRPEFNDDLRLTPPTTDEEEEEDEEPGVIGRPGRGEGSLRP